MSKNFRNKRGAYPDHVHDDLQTSTKPQQISLPVGVDPPVRFYVE